jgi:hypothetical protein
MVGVVAFLGLVLSIFMAYGDQVFEGNVRILYFYYALEGVFGLSDQGYIFELFDIWRGFFIYPESEVGAIFGFGVNGRSGFYVASDIGYVLYIWGLGWLGLSLVLILHLVVLLRVWMLRSVLIRSGYGIAVCYFVVLVLILALKEQELLVRHVLSALAVCYFIVYGADVRSRG